MMPYPAVMDKTMLRTDFRKSHRLNYLQSTSGRGATVLNAEWGPPTDEERRRREAVVFQPHWIENSLAQEEVGPNQPTEEELRAACLQVKSPHNRKSDPITQYKDASLGRFDSHRLIISTSEHDAVSEHPNKENHHRKTDIITFKDHELGQGKGHQGENEWFEAQSQRHFNRRESEFNFFIEAKRQAQRGARYDPSDSRPNREYNRPKSADIWRPSHNLREDQGEHLVPGPTAAPHPFLDPKGGISFRIPKAASVWPWMHEQSQQPDLPVHYQAIKAECARKKREEAAQLQERLARMLALEQQAKKQAGWASGGTRWADETEREKQRAEDERMHKEEEDRKALGWRAPLRSFTGTSISHSNHNSAPDMAPDTTPDVTDCLEPHENDHEPAEESVPVESPGRDCYRDARLLQAHIALSKKQLCESYRRPSWWG